MNAYAREPQQLGTWLAQDTRPKAVVIGTGFGGLAAAIRLHHKGYAVSLYEKLDAPGGRAYVHHQDGFAFDAGPTIITAPHLLEELWALCGQRMQDDVTLAPMDPFYRIFFDDGEHIDFHHDSQRMRDEVIRLSPNDVAGYDRFVEVCDRCKTLGFEGMGTKPFDHLWDLIEEIPAFLRMGAWRSLYAQVKRHVRHPNLRVALSFHPLLIGGNPMKVTAAYALIHSLERTWGVHSAMGGTGAIVRGLVRLIEDLGIPIHYNAPVTQIMTESGRACGIELANGQTQRADIVVSNADVVWTYKHLVPNSDQSAWTNFHLDHAHHSMGLFVWYFGTRRRYDHLPHHSMVLGPRYEGLLKDIFVRKQLSRDFSIYLHRPTATDPSVAPSGCDAFYALVPVPHLGSGTDWRLQAEPMREALQQRLNDTVLPGFAKEIITSRLATPQTFEQRLWSHLGAGFGLEPRLVQSAWFRPHNRSKSLPGLYLVGAGTHPGAGVPGVLMSAKALEQVVPHVVQR